MVMLSLTDKHYDNPGSAYCSDTFIHLSNLKTAVLPPYSHWPLLSSAPNLESLTREPRTGLRAVEGAAHQVSQDGSNGG